MDNRDKHLHRHMKLRMELASELAPIRKLLWAQKCLQIAQRQRRSAFYLMVSLWIADLNKEFHY